MTNLDDSLFSDYSDYSVSLSPPDRDLFATDPILTIADSDAMEENCPATNNGKFRKKREGTCSVSSPPANQLKIPTLDELPTQKEKEDVPIFEIIHDIYLNDVRIFPTEDKKKCEIKSLLFSRVIGVACDGPKSTNIAANVNVGIIYSYIENCILGTSNYPVV